MTPSRHDRPSRSRRSTIAAHPATWAWIAAATALPRTLLDTPIALAVRAQEVPVAGHEARLFRRLVVARSQRGVRQRGAESRDEGGERVGRAIIADDADQHRHSAETGDVGGDVACSAQRAVLRAQSATRAQALPVKRARRHRSTKWSRMMIADHQDANAADVVDQHPRRRIIGSTRNWAPRTSSANRTSKPGRASAPEASRSRSP